MSGLLDDYLKSPYALIPRFCSAFLILRIGLPDYWLTVCLNSDYLSKICLSACGLVVCLMPDYLSETWLSALVQTRLYGCLQLLN